MENNPSTKPAELGRHEGASQGFITGAEALMRSLEHQGVDTLFGYPGGSIMPVFDALYDHRATLKHILVRHETKVGECYFIPGGLVHAIGEDVCVYEVQQSSNTTYRLYDWGRVGANGKPRPLHVDASLKSIDFNLPPPAPRADVACPFFRFRAVEAAGAVEVAANAETFTALFFVRERRSVLVPANCAATIPYNGKVLVTTL